MTAQIVKANWYKYDEGGASPTVACESGAYYYFYDALGNVNGVLEEKNGLYRYYKWEMDAFGNDLPGGNDLLAMDQSGPKEHLTGKMFDTVTGLYYFHARWYDPEVGRFVGRDPAKAEDNLYIFTKNNPVTLTDPDGLIPSDNTGPSCIYLSRRRLDVEFLPDVVYHTEFAEEYSLLHHRMWVSAELLVTKKKISFRDMKLGYVNYQAGLGRYLMSHEAKRMAYIHDITNYCPMKKCLRLGFSNDAFDMWAGRIHERGVPWGMHYDEISHNCNHYMNDLLSLCCPGIKVSAFGYPIGF